MPLPPMGRLTNSTDDIEALVRRFHELPAGVPGHFTFDELNRGQQISLAEGARVQAQLAALDVMDEAFQCYPNAATAGEAVRLAGRNEEVVRLQAAIPAPDVVGMRWFVEQVERSLGEGTLLMLPPT